jgi:hypothetical protein
MTQTGIIGSWQVRGAVPVTMRALHVRKFVDDDAGDHGIGPRHFDRLLHVVSVENRVAGEGGGPGFDRLGSVGCDLHSGLHGVAAVDHPFGVGVEPLHPGFRSQAEQ